MCADTTVEERDNFQLPIVIYQICWYCSKHVEAEEITSWGTGRSTNGGPGSIYHDRLPFPYVRGREYQTES